ncbi:MAG TPA: hypothetical protein VFA58_04945 [Chthoniobacterales bacterium]|nr:hypothetical protein [Chthoniobacterales bacterium]
MVARSWLIFAILFLASVYLWYRADVRRKQQPTDIEVPIRLSDGSALDIPLSIPPERACEARIQYPRPAARDIWKDLHELKGVATLTRKGKVLAQAAMPTHAISGYMDFAGTTLFRFHSGAGDQKYVLSLRLSYVPADLHNIEGKVKIQDDFFHYKDALGLTLLSRSLAVVIALSAIPLVYFCVQKRKASQRIDGTD